MLFPRNLDWRSRGKRRWQAARGLLVDEHNRSFFLFHYLDHTFQGNFNMCEGNFQQHPLLNISFLLPFIPFLQSLERFMCFNRYFYLLKFPRGSARNSKLSLNSIPVLTSNPSKCKLKSNKKNRTCVLL